MNGAALERVFRDASGRLVAALAARYRDLDLAEDAFAEATARAIAAWSDKGVPRDPAAWLYRVADRVTRDALRRRAIRRAHRPDAPPPPPTPEDDLVSDAALIPDERLRLIFVCCHPALAPESRAALTLRLVCGLSVEEIARAFLVSPPALAKRLVRAKQKIQQAGISFEVPPPGLWPDRLEAVLSTLEVAYAQAHQDAAGKGVHAAYAQEILELTALLAKLAPAVGEAQALAALVRYSEARRPARTDADGVMIPLSEQDPRLWRRELIGAGDRFLAAARQLAPRAPRTLQAELQAAWAARRSREEPAPWAQVLQLYDRLLAVRDDPVVRLNRAVAQAELDGPMAALAAIADLDPNQLADYPPYHAVRAALLARLGDPAAARAAYAKLLALGPGPAERRWLEAQVAGLPQA